MAHDRPAKTTSVALMYNIRDIVAAGKNGKVDLSEGNYCSIFRDNMMHAASTHWLHPSYLKIAGSPVLFLYTLRDYINYRDCLKLTFQGIKNSLGVYPYIVADTVWWSPSPHKMDWGGMAAINVSAVTGFNTFDAGQPEKMEQSFSYYSSQLFHEMAAPAWSKRIQVIPTILAGCLCLLVSHRVLT
ncbi:hypothetical protein T484DRAFT_1808976 [Baffinella frigidus]|nr:hypothetical protein T484DRAFT_1808976 [Cryptophyta sp. CCMP2293]